MDREGRLRTPLPVFDMKRVLCFLLCILFLCAIPTAAAEETGICGDNLSWTVADGVLTISGHGDMYWYDMGSAPWYPLRQSIRSAVVEEGVTALSYCCFFYLTELREVSLPGTMGSLGGMAFYGCRSLPEITIPAEVYEIGEDAFYGCRSLYAIHVDASSSSFWEDDGVLYSGTSLICYPAARPQERYEILSGTERVEVCAFSYSPLKEIRIPESVRSFDMTALTDCYLLQSVEVAWGNWYYTAREGVLYSGSMETLICYPAQKWGSSYRVPTEVRRIAIRAFANNANLRSLEIMGDLTELGSLAFLNCSALRRVYFRGDAPENLGFSPFPENTRVFYLLEGSGWTNADAETWNVREMQPWAERVDLPTVGDRLTQ